MRDVKQHSVKWFSSSGVEKNYLTERRHGAPPSFLQRRGDATGRRVRGAAALGDSRRRRRARPTAIAQHSTTGLPRLAHKTQSHINANRANLARTAAARTLAPVVARMSSPPTIVRRYHHHSISMRAFFPATVRRLFNRELSQQWSTVSP